MDACICIGKLGVKDRPIAIDRLMELYETFSDWNKKALCLETLVKLFDCTDKKTFKFLMSQMEHSPYWSARTSAARLLSFIGKKEKPNFNCLFYNFNDNFFVYIVGPLAVGSHEYFSAIYELLETKLANDPIREVRLTIGNTIKDLRIYDIFANRMIK